MDHGPQRARPRLPTRPRLPLVRHHASPAVLAINAYAARYTDQALRELARGSLLAAGCGFCLWGVNPDGGRHLIEHVWAGELCLPLAYNALRYAGRDGARFTLGDAGCLARRDIRRYLHGHLMPQERPANRRGAPGGGPVGGGGG